MAKDPAFLFYSSDFLTGTMIMPFEDRGKYITILCYMHQNGRLNEETIRLLVGSISDNLRLKFDVDKKGFLYNDRLEIEIEKRRNFVESRLENGKKGGRPPKKDTLNEKPLGYPIRNLPENENIIEDIDINKEENKKHSEICLKILSDFKFSQQRNPDKLRQVSEFIKRLNYDNKFEWFKDQYISYWKYKKISSEEKQGLETFISGGWDRQNWTEKLIENGKRQTTEAKRESVAEAADRAREILRGD